MKQTIVMDFDGVIHSYVSGWKGLDVIPDPPVEGIKDCIKLLREKYRVVVVSSRTSNLTGRYAVEKYLDENDIRVDDVCCEKPPALAYIDDRAICFDGDVEALIGKIDGFRPWMKKRKSIPGNTPIRVGATYRHFKGGKYRILAESISADNKEPLITYMDYKGNTWTRSRREFTDKVLVDGEYVPRFEYLGSNGRGE